jgi:hypothetical protein
MASSNATSFTNKLPTLLLSHNLHYQIETPSTALHLISQHQLTPSNFIELYPDIERTLLTSFVEDDYDGRLKFMTLNLSLRDSTSETSDNGLSGHDRKVVGIAFWREVDQTEMEEWMDLHRVKETLRRHRALDETMHSSSQNGESKTRQNQSNSQAQQQRRISFKCSSDDTLSQDGRRSMEMIRNDSVTWIRNALNSCDDAIQTTSMKHINNVNPVKTFASSTSTINEKVATITHSWIKIELLAIHQSHRHHQYGKLLLACVLSKALQHHESHAILHIAGSTSNIAARKLYETFGFVHLLKYEEGGPFEKPDGDLYVLGDIGRVLSRYPWDEMW